MFAKYLDIVEEPPLLVQPEEESLREILRAFLVVSVLGYTGLLIYLRVTVGEISPWKLALWVAACPLALLSAWFFPRKYLILYESYVFVGYLFWGRVFMFSRTIPYESISEISVYHFWGDPRSLSLFVGHRSSGITVPNRYRLAEIMKILRSKVGPHIADEDA
jgi:hypothetical protein